MTTTIENITPTIYLRYFANRIHAGKHKKKKKKINTTGNEIGKKGPEKCPFRFELYRRIKNIKKSSDQVYERDGIARFKTQRNSRPQDVNCKYFILFFNFLLHRTQIRLTILKYLQIKLRR